MLVKNTNMGGKKKLAGEDIQQPALDVSPLPTFRKHYFFVIVYVYPVGARLSSMR
jgi:hypothetical protein